MKLRAFIACALLSISLAATAQHVLDGPDIDTGQTWGFTLTPEIVRLSGVSREIVYPDPDYNHQNSYLSLLNWQMNQVLLNGMTVSVNYQNFLFLNAGIWQAFSSRDSGLMEDFDWFYSNLTQWTHYSNHDIFIESSNLYDLSLSLVYFRKNPFSLNLLLGFSQKRWYWTDEVNYFIYSSAVEYTNFEEGITPLHDIWGNYPPETHGISYEVLYTIPYLGVGLKLDTRYFSLQGRGIYTFLTAATDHDHHILRNLHFIDVFNSCQTVGAGMELRCFPLPGLYISLKADYFYIFETRGAVYQFNEDWVLTGGASTGGGIQYETFCLSLTLGVTH